MDRTMRSPLLIDTHCHLADPAFAGRLPAVIRAGRMAGVMKFIAPAIEPEEWQRLQVLHKSHSEIFPAYGLHPMHARLFSRSVLEELESCAQSAIAIGEIGLDYTLAVSREIQMHSFRQQLRLARKLDLPVLLHCRKAFQDLITILQNEGEGRIKGVMHAFSGSVETAVKCMGIGLYISMAGTVTFANAVRPVAVARKMPLSHLLLETDAPDLSPEPYRGTCNEPAFLMATATKIAEIKGLTLGEVAAQTSRNAVELFRLPALLI
ncbi:TatD family hydrolase [Geotalea daltonii]|nr:TatD family hydrolase [Geotalea daltonii]